MCERETEGWMETKMSLLSSITRRMEGLLFFSVCKTVTNRNESRGILFTVHADCMIHLQTAIRIPPQYRVLVMLALIT